MLKTVLIPPKIYNLLQFDTICENKAIKTVL